MKLQPIFVAKKGCFMALYPQFRCKIYSAIFGVSSKETWRYGRKVRKRLNGHRNGGWADLLHLAR
jgi:hypothetical protein